MNLPNVPDRPSAPPDPQDDSEHDIDAIAERIEERQSDTEWLDTLIDVLIDDFRPGPLPAGVVSPELNNSAFERHERIRSRLMQLRHAYRWRDRKTFMSLISEQMNGEYIRRAEEETR